VVSTSSPPSTAGVPLVVEMTGASVDRLVVSCADAAEQQRAR
jgi:hypothetical protein